MMAVFPYNADDKDIRTLFCEYPDEYNKKSEKPYSVAASIGIYITANGEKPDFEELVKKSDVLMYEEKKRRKLLAVFVKESIENPVFSML